MTEHENSVLTEIIERQNTIERENNELKEVLLEVIERQNTIRAQIEAIEKYLSVKLKVTKAEAEFIA